MKLTKLISLCEATKVDYAKALEAYEKKHIKEEPPRTSTRAEYSDWKRMGWVIEDAKKILARKPETKDPIVKNWLDKNKINNDFELYDVLIAFSDSDRIKMMQDYRSATKKRWEINKDWYNEDFAKAWDNGGTYFYKSGDFEWSLVEVLPDGNCFKTVLKANTYETSLWEFIGCNGQGDVPRLECSHTTLSQFGKGGISLSKMRKVIDAFSKKSVSSNTLKAIEYIDKNFPDGETYWDFAKKFPTMIPNELKKIKNPFEIFDWFAKQDRDNKPIFENNEISIKTDHAYAFIKKPKDNFPRVIMMKDWFRIETIGKWMRMADLEAKIKTAVDSRTKRNIEREMSYIRSRGWSIE